jgi:F-type H+-transporting ATPase subunit epsilon
MPLTCEIVSPAKLLLSRDVDMVVMPGYEGDLAAMPDHAPLITLLRGGVITLFEGGNPTDKFYVAGGFAEITPERCTILADSATPVGELSADHAQDRLKRAEQAWEEVDKADIGRRDAVLDELQSAREEVRVAGQV